MTGLEIGAMCTIRDLYAFSAPDDWRAAPLFATSCEAFLASFKVWNSATVGGNICMSLPAGPMITMTVALEATYTLWATDGSERTVDAADFVTGNHANILGPGRDPAEDRHPDQRTAQAAHAPPLHPDPAGPVDDLHDRDATPGRRRPAADDHRGHHPPGAAALSTPCPTPTTLQHGIDAMPDDVWFDDPNGTPDHRRHLAKHFAEEIRIELSAGAWS